jgi:hypothetical protein
MTTTSPIEEKPRSVLSEKDVSGVEVERSRTEHQEIVQRYEDSKARRRVLRKVRLIPAAVEHRPPGLHEVMELTLLNRSTYD